MSSLSAPSPVDPAPRSPSSRTTSRAASPRLRVLAPPPATRRRLPFAAACVALLALSLLGLLLLNIALTRGAYDVQGLQREATLLGEHEQALAEQLAARAAPGPLSESAAELGMVPSTSPAFVRLSDGAVLGVPQPAEAPPAPPVASPPPTTPITADTDVAPTTD